MIPTIKKETHFAGGHPIYSYECWTVRGKYGCDECRSFGRAIRYWLWHCGVPAKIAFWGIHRKEYP
jgi:hypothetical protein